MRVLKIVLILCCLGVSNFSLLAMCKVYDVKSEKCGLAYAARLAYWHKKVAEAIAYERKVNGGLPNWSDDEIAAQHRIPYIFDKNYLGLALSVYEYWNRQQVKAFYTPGLMICHATGAITKGVFAIGRSEENSLIYHRFMRPESQFGVLKHREALPKAVVNEYQRRTNAIDTTKIVKDIGELAGSVMNDCRVTFAYPDGHDEGIKESYYVKDLPYGVSARIKDEKAFNANPCTYVALKAPKK